MSLVDHDSHQERAVQRRPPPVVILEPSLDSPIAAEATGNGIPLPAGPLMLAPRPTSLGVARLPPAVAGPLMALAGPADRQPLIYSGDAAVSLAALRQDIVSSYRAICGALGEPLRTDLVDGNLRGAGVLNLQLPLALGAPPAPRLPRLAGGPSLASMPLLLPPVPPCQAGTPVPPVKQSGIGIGGVGSGCDAPARVLLTSGSASGSGGGLPAGAVAGRHNTQLMGALRSLSAGHASLSAAAGLPPLARGGRADVHWPMGRPVASSPIGRGSGRGSSSDGPRVAMVSGLTRPQDPNSDFLGEESAVLYPPAGRSFEGGTSAVARALMGGTGLGPGQMIDAMDDFRFRAGGHKHVKIEDLDDPSRLIPGFRRNDDMQLEVFLKEYARDRSKPSQALQRGGPSRYNMPF